METSARHIVLLSDGTGNSRGKHFTTNVWRLYEALDVADPADPLKPRQFAFYDDGVGSSTFRPYALLSGALGIGLARNVRDLYRFLCRIYRPGDRIYAFGFSRGAFTIRVLIGLIMNQGLVPYTGDEAELERLTAAAYRAYRRKYTLAVNYIGPLRDLRDAVIDGWARVRHLPTYEKTEKIGLAGTDSAVEIEFLGLWDTVDAYGLPIDELSRALNAVVWPAKMPDLKLDKRVKRAVHALALDDERNTFHPLLWDESEESQQGPERISQVWFAGMHSDVGGGYADQGLSHVSLSWVAREAALCDLRFVPSVRERQEGLSDANGPMNDSRRGLAGYYRYNPRRLEPLLEDAGCTQAPKVHESVLRRIHDGQDGYAPIVLPSAFKVQRLKDDTDLNDNDADGASETGFQGFSEPQGQVYANGRERVFNLVWWKRLVYFITLAFSFALLVRPLVADAGHGACASDFWCWLSPFIRAVDAVLPSTLSGWTGWYATHPGQLLALGIPAALGLWVGLHLQRRIGNAMRRVWYGIDTLRPLKMATVPPSPPEGWLGRAVRGLRKHPIYQAGFRLLTRYGLPTGAFAGMAYGSVVALSVLAFAISASVGGVCVARDTRLVSVHDLPHESTFKATEVCTSTGASLEAGGTYQLVVTLTGAWKDRGIDADLGGLAESQVTRAMQFGTPLRRELQQPWMLPLARIGALGSDVYPLHPDPSLPYDRELRVLSTTFVARSTGELFVYVNDAIGPPGLARYFYDNNQGEAKVSVMRVRPAGETAPVPAVAKAEQQTAER